MRQYPKTRLQMEIWRALHAVLVRLHARKHISAPVHPHPHTPHALTDTEICNTYRLSTATVAS